MLLKFKKKLYFFLSIFICGILVFSCVSHSNLVYLQNTNSIDFEAPIHKKQYRLQPNDDIKIEFTSTDPSTSALLNKTTGLSPSNQINNASLFINSYTIDSVGNLDIPLVGTIKAKGLTTDVLANSIYKSLENILKLKTVTIKIANYRLSVLGEVKIPGTYYAYNEHTTIFQALAMAGDLTDMANRHRIKVIRNDISNGNCKIYYIDITDSNILQSDVYYLFPNDAIYIEPAKAKASRINLPVIQVVLTAVSAILLVLSILNKA